MRLMKRCVTNLTRWWGSRRGTWWWAIVVIVVPVMLVAGAAVTVLLSFVDAVDPKNQIELIKTGLTVGAGTGGVVALVLTGRRQWSTEHDATERRMTELYVKAVEQLGSNKAAVRHGGLYALERVAQDNPDHRQTVINVLCAYLRAPFTLPGEQRPRQRRGIRRPLAPASRHGTISLTQTGRTEDPTAAELDDETRQEQEVRLTAQRIIGAHLRPGEDRGHPLDTFWADIDLDLTGATLIDFDLSGTQLRTATFISTNFAGYAGFNGTSFAGQAGFQEVSFAKFAGFNGASFNGYAGFDGTSFNGYAGFNKASFNGHAGFHGTSFNGHSGFDGANFNEYVGFDRASFTEEARFNNVTFLQSPDISDAEFGQGVPEPLRTYVEAEASSLDRTGGEAVPDEMDHS